LKQVLLNLVSNAIKFTPAGGRIEVAARSGAEHIIIEVTDTGIGIAPEDLATALAPFGQVDSKLTRRFGGTGLGLPLTKALVELHGGRFELHSALGAGTTARILLPPARLVA
jgi:signal transduction histidine kinase